MKRPPRLSIEQLLSSGEPILLDGGLATELEAQGFDIDSPLWSAELLLSHPEAISAAHRAFLAAGADVLIASSYQLSAMGLEAMGIPEQRLEELLCESIRLALQAASEFDPAIGRREFRPLVAASVGPYGAALADGSEYRGAYGVDDAMLRSFHEPRLGILDSSGAQLLACETIPSRQEAHILCDLLRDVKTPAWVSFSCRDGAHLNDGTPIEACAELFALHPNVFAIGVNCTSPQHVPTLIDGLKRGAPDKAVVVYPNSGESFDPDRRTWSGTASSSECGQAAGEWRERGATLIGGCCRMGPTHIRAMADRLR